jgi:hypothetical protein
MKVAVVSSAAGREHTRPLASVRARRAAPREPTPRDQRGIRSSGKSIKMVDHAQGWQGRDVGGVPRRGMLIDVVSEPRSRACT